MGVNLASCDILKGRRNGRDRCIRIMKRIMRIFIRCLENRSLTRDDKCADCYKYRPAEPVSLRKILSSHKVSHKATFFTKKKRLKEAAVRFQFSSSISLSLFSSPRELMNSVRPVAELSGRPSCAHFRCRPASRRRKRKCGRSAL